MSFNLLEHPIVFTSPERLTANSSWIGHIPFAYLLLDLLKPRALVELGTQDGVSYSAFCQGVKTLELNTRCTAVDTWIGDRHTGFYGPGTLADLKKFHNPRFASFSRLLQSDFDLAIHSFADGSIDLLHIDGLHTYQAVRHNFQTYLPKLSDSGVVLLHDSAMRTGDFGVYQLVDELAQRYGHFEFLHSCGLAVVLVGKAVPAAVVEFVNAANDAPDGYRALFSQLGGFHEMLLTANQLFGIQFKQMQAVNAFKAARGLAIDPNTQQPEVVASRPVQFGKLVEQEISGILNQLKARPATDKHVA